jgi:uncharacterized protein
MNMRVPKMQKQCCGMWLLLGCWMPAMVGAQDCPPLPVPLEQAKQQIENTPAKNAGLLWRFEKSGRVSWLYGTMHLMHIDYAKPGPQIMMAMRNSDVLAVEINLYEPQPESAHRQQTPAPWTLSALQTQRLKAAYQKECIKLESFQVSTNLLVQTQAQRQGLFWGYGPDARLMQIAKRSNKPMVQLESIEQQRQALAPRSQAELEAQVISSLDEYESGALANYIEKLATAWQNNDLQTFVKDTEANDRTQPAFMTRINDERNVLMAEKIDALHIEGKHVFVAVGATHMTGKFALPQLLEDKGYKVHFVPLRNN